MVLLMTTLLADNHQIVKDEYCSTMSTEVWTFFVQVQDFIDTELQNKMTLRGGEFLKGGRKRKREGGERGGRGERNRDSMHVPSGKCFFLWAT